MWSLQKRVEEELGVQERILLRRIFGRKNVGNVEDQVDEACTADKLRKDIKKNTGRQREGHTSTRKASQEVDGRRGGRATSIGWGQKIEDQGA